NKLTTDAVARLILQIVKGEATSKPASSAMLRLMHRDPQSTSNDPDDQANKFMGKSLPPGSEYYSKAGWTSSTRHDSAYIRLPNGAEYIAVVFTIDNSKQADIIPLVSRLIAEDFSRPHAAADLALINSRIWTGDKSRPWAEALASRGELIIAVGSNDDVKKLTNSKTRIIDLPGKLVLPGFIDD